MSLELTVIVPVLDRAERLRDAVATVLSQSETASVIVVDDGSTATFAAEVDEMAAREPRVRVVHQPNRGPAAARNTGLKLVTSRFVMFLDSDDELAATAFRAMDPLLGQGDVGLLCGAVGVVLPDSTGRTEYPSVNPGVPGAKLSHLAGSFAARTDVAQAVGGYDEALRFGENTDFIIRLAEECRRRALPIIDTNEVLSTYYAAPDERRYDAKRLEAAEHLLRRGRCDLEVPGERARLHAIAAVNAARVRRYRLSVRHSALAAFAEPRNPRHLLRVALSVTGPLARHRWLSSSGSNGRHRPELGR